MAGVTTVGFFTDRVQRVLELQANRLLGADLVIADSRPPAIRNCARKRCGAGWRRSRSSRFPSMAVQGDRTVLADVKVVSPGYPLRGELRIADRLFGPDRVAGTIPGPGTVWVDERLHTALGLGADDRIGLGSAGCRVAAIVTHEPGWRWDF